jgi:hypothetical protein
MPAAAAAAAAVGGWGCRLPALGRRTSLLQALLQAPRLLPLAAPMTAEARAQAAVAAAAPVWAQVPAPHWQGAAAAAAAATKSCVSFPSPKALVATAPGLWRLWQRAWRQKPITSVGAARRSWLCCRTSSTARAARLYATSTATWLTGSCRLSQLPTPLLQTPSTTLMQC